MIITKLQGGLGNQLFQWAYGKSLSIKHNTNLFLDLSFYANQGVNTPRVFELYRFPNFKHEQPQIEAKNTLHINDDFHYSELSYNEKYNYFLNGFWQSEKYFLNVSDIIKQTLQPTQDTLNKLKQRLTDKSVSLHIRRTDYVTSNGFHPVQDISYYEKALEIIGDYNQVLIFSDDINWCKNNLNFKNMVFVEAQSNLDDLWLMSLCDHNIIANSSFSWWGAWLNQNPNKVVIAPSNWFGPMTGLNQLDIIPENWVKI